METSGKPQLYMCPHSTFMCPRSHHTAICVSSCVLILLYVSYVFSYCYTCITKKSCDALPYMCAHTICPHKSYAAMFVLLHMCLHTHAAICVSSYCYICVLILLYVCPHTSICVSSYYYMCARILLHVCPHTVMCVSSYCYLCVLCMCAHLP